MNKSGQKMNKSSIYILYQLYKSMDISEMKLDEFTNFLKIPGTPIAKQCFKHLDLEEKGSINPRHLLIYLILCTTASKQEILKFAFSVFDDD